MHTLYDFTIPVFIKTLTALKGVLAKGEASAQAMGVSETAFLEERLAPDMFPLVKQVQVACDQAKGAAARLTGTEMPRFEDTEKTFLELTLRIDKTVQYLSHVSKEQFAGADTQTIELPYFPGKYMLGFEYVQEYVLPNFFFHVTTAYDILRHKGVDLGKADFTGALPLKDN